MLLKFNTEQAMTQIYNKGLGSPQRSFKASNPGDLIPYIEKTELTVDTFLCNTIVLYPSVSSQFSEILGS